ncbi:MULTISPECIES: helix-turn-helix domain-containing protein [Paenibacillus]|jgi:transcriptional regulator with XRE-family HTH domain|uniref:helix-turn-helix domain-containing protein n=1 Tax=Paenibacillus TaxID=44249 RepID=UPI00041B214D|nr:MULTISPECIES: helix-turn-helix transcriptional regulator [Paenibacillus]KGP83434.1 transcriptional regulator [Paenibacillus sp. MAEPY2]KGP86269.1 transcriptional regulator [Paenibacillus sp. MAEPY1]OZQ66862.1 transcriptional regulator [Paenibacillus taichungensis]HBU83666.1 XRE family transcriptional regulator [Paenibacillus sp.]
MNLPESVGNRIRELRKAKGWTQEQLAEAAGLHYSYIGGVERGDRNISLETLEKIINGFQVPAEEIFKFQEESEYKRALDEHITLISGKSSDEIASLTKINKEILMTIEKLQKGSD